MSDVFRSRWARREEARNAYATRTAATRERDAFFTRVAEHEVLGRIITRRHGIEPQLARWIALSAPGSPVMRAGVRRRGRPPAGAELVDFVEQLAGAAAHARPVRRGFWPFVTRMWNATVSAERTEATYALDDWRGLRMAYVAASRRLEQRADALFAAYGLRMACAWPTWPRRDASSSAPDALFAAYKGDPSASVSPLREGGAALD